MFSFRSAFVWGLLAAALTALPALAEDLTVKPYQEPAKVKEFVAAEDTAKSGDSRLAVARDFQQKYPDEVVLQMVTSNLLLMDDMNGTRQYYKDRAEKHPDNAIALYLAGRLAEDAKGRGDYAQKILDKDPNNYWGYLLKSSSYGADGDPGKKLAEADLRKAISIDNSLPFAVEQLGQVLQDRGDKDGADAVYVKLGEMQPARFAAVRHRLILLGNDYEKAIALLDDFLKKNPKDQDALNAKARDQRELKDWSGHVKTMQTLYAVAQSPDNAYNLACGFSLAGQTDSAFAYLFTATDLGFNDIGQYKDDEDLIPLRDDKRWSDLLDRVDANQKKDLAKYLEQAKATAPQRKEQAISAKINEPAPDFSLQDLDGKTVSLASLKGKVVILDFWATWCGPCKLTMPLLDKFYTTDKPKDVLVYGVNVWERGNTDKVKPFIQEKGYHFPILYGSTDLASDYGVQGIPTLFVIDKDGKIAYKHIGYDPTIPEVLGWQTKELLK